MNIPTQHTKINIVSYQIARFTDVFQWISWLHNVQAITNTFHYLSGHLPNMKNKWINNVKLKGNIVNVCCIRCNWYTWIVNEPIPICIGYRRRYGLFTDISVLPIRQLLIGIGYRYRPIWYLISVHNQIALLQSYDTNLTRKIWKNSSKWDFALLTEFVKSRQNDTLDF